MAWRFAPMAVLAAVQGTALAQDLPQISRDMFEDRLRRDGDAMTMCVNPDALLADFDAAVAVAIGDALLLETRVSPVTPPTRTVPYDYRLPLSFEQIFVLLAEECDGFMGFVLGADSYPAWLRVTQPYFESEMVLVTSDPGVRQLAELPFDRPIGARSLSAADNRMLGYLNALPEDRRWKRQAFYSHDQVVEALQDGRLGAALIWKPALEALVGPDLSAAGLHLIEAPFTLDPVTIGIVIESANGFLQSSLSEAIAALVADGTIARLYAETMGAAAAP